MSAVVGARQDRPQSIDQPKRSARFPRYRLLVIATRVAIAAAFIGIWALAVGTNWVSAFFVSTPAKTAEFLQNHWHELLTNAWATLEATLIAFALSAAAGIVSGLVLSENRFLSDVLNPYITALNSLPRIALAPLFTLWFGIGVESKVVLAFSLSFFVVLVNTTAGLKTVDESLLQLSSSLGCNSVQRFVRIKLPWAVPSIFAGLRLALIYAFLGVVTSEMLGSRNGLGQLIVYYSGIFRTDGVLAVLAVLGAAAVLLTFIAQRIESYLLRGWATTTT